MMVFCKITAVVLVMQAFWYNKVECKIKYAVAFLPQDDQSEYHLVVSNPGDDITVMTMQSIRNGSVETSSRTIDSGETEVIENSLLQPLILNGSGIENKTLIVEFDRDDIVLQGFVKTSGGHKEGYLALPNIKLGTEYVVSTFCEFGGHCQIAIAAVEPGNTTVSITFPGHVTDIVFCIGDTYFRSRRDKLLVLKEYDVVLLETPYDLTGTQIASTKKIAVFSGTRNMTIENSTAGLIEQLPPTSLFGRQFISTTLGSNGYGDILHIASSMRNNLITMQGYRSFIIADTAHVVQRRLDADTSTFIQGIYPIQVTQFSGLTYASLDPETPNPGMTVVPAVDQYIPTALHQCGNDETSGKYTLIQPKNGNTGLEGVPYTDYGHQEMQWSGSQWEPVDTVGILKCGDSILMPIGLAKNLASPVTTAPAMTYGDQVDNDEDGSVDEDFCTKNTKVTIRSMLDIGARDYHTEDVTGVTLVKLRLRTCGIGLIKLNKTNGERLFLQISRSNIQSILCGSECMKEEDATIGYNIDPNNCEKNNLYIWIRFDADTGVCVGAGPIPGSCADAIVTHTAAPRTCTTMELSAMLKEAVFYVDTIREDCAAVVNDWMCEDKRYDCELYGKSVCTELKFEPWMNLHCKEYCQKCIPDAHGREFLFSLPAGGSSKAAIAVTSTAPVGVAVTYTSKTIKSTHFDQNVGIFVIQQVDPAELVHIKSEADASVSVLYTYGNNMLHTFNVLPFDALGFEYMALTYCGTSISCACVLVPREVDTKVKIYTPQTVGWQDDAEEITIQYGTWREIKAQNKGDEIVGTVFKSDKPLYVFCGNNGAATTQYVHFNQMTPTNTWGKTFITPGMEQDVVQRPYEGRLRIVANVDNTLVTIGGDFDALHPIYKRGDYIDQDVDIGTVYTIETTFPVAVGLFLYDATKPEGDAISFTLLPPKEQMTKLHNINIYGTETIHEILDTYVPTSYTLHSVDQEGQPTNQENTNIVSSPEPVHIYHKHSSTEKDSTMIGVLKTANSWTVFPGLQTIKQIHGIEETCVISLGSVPDDVDNDCDGLNGEDINFTGYGARRNDMDLDGGFGEDCSRVETGLAPKSKDYDTKTRQAPSMYVVE